MVASGCGGSADGPGHDPGLSELEVGASSTGRALENSTACTVDATCYLRIEFADTTIDALYGTGERPAPPEH